MLQVRLDNHAADGTGHFDSAQADEHGAKGTQPLAITNNHHTENLTSIPLSFTPLIPGLIDVLGRPA